MVDRWYLPRLPAGAIDRPALFDRMDQWPEITRVQAPSGYGKTVGVAHWVQRRVPAEVDVIWVEVDPARGTAAQVWADIAAAAQSAAVEGTQGSDPDSVHHVLTSFRTSPLLVVLDAVENVEDPEPIETLARWAQRWRHLHLIVMGRQVPELRAAVNQSFISMSDLRFGMGEAIEVYRKSDSGVGTDLIRRTLVDYDGWPVALHQAARSSADLGSGSTADGRVARVVDGLLLDGLAPQLVDFAERAAVVRHVSPDRLGILDPSLSPHEARSLSTQLSHHGLLTSSDLPRATLDFPPLIGARLRELAGANSHIDVPALRRRAVADHRGAGEWAWALEQALALGDVELLGDLLAECWQWVILSRRDLIEQSLARIPEATISSHSELSSLWTSLFETTRTALEHPLPGDPDELRAIALSAPMSELLLDWLLRLRSLRFSGELHAAAEQGRRLATVIEEALTAQRDGTQDLAALLMVHVAIGLQLIDRPNEARQWLVRSAALSLHDASGMALRDLQGALALSHAVDGVMPRAAQWSALESQHPPLQSWMERNLATKGRLSRVWLALECLDRAEAERTLAELAGQQDDDEYWAFILQAQSVYHQLWGDPATMLEEIERTLTARAHLAPSGSHARTALAHARFDLNLTMGRGGLAERALSEAPPQHPGTVVRSARFALVRGEPDLVLAEAPYGESRSCRVVLEMLLLRSSALLTNGDDEQARRTLKRAGALLRLTGLRTPLTGLPRHLLEELLALDEGGALDIAREAIENGLPASCPERIDRVALTDSERLVLRGLADGVPTVLVAGRAHLSTNTIKTHRRTLYRKLGANSRVEALVRATEHGLI